MRRKIEFITPIAIPEIKKRVQVYKYYTRTKKFGERRCRANRALEGVYHQILKSIKKLYAQLPNESDRIIFEINRKRDSNSVVGMHDFVSSSLFWILECDVMGHYWIYYAFGNCPFKQLIKDKFDYCSLNSNLKVEPIEDYDTYYKNVLGCQRDKYISILSFAPVKQ